MNDINDIVKQYGYIKKAVPSGLNIIDAIKNLKKEKNAIILAHFYQTGDIQDIADFVGDSLKLAQEAEKTDADIIVFAGVHFMAETAKILNPNKKVILPDLNASCSLAESAPYKQFKAFREAHSDHVVVSYVNSSTEVKALTDIICTSSNAVEIINSIPADKPILFAPDKNLGSYLEKMTGKKMTLWDGACHVHKAFSVEKIIALKKDFPNAKILAHPECEKPLLTISDYIGSTSALLKYTDNIDINQFIVATESGILHQMQKQHPDKMFIPAPPDDSTCACNDCEFMKMNTLEKIYWSLKEEAPQINIEENLRLQALRPIKAMLDISAKKGL
ncbi:MAG: quinolinate synthase NadA [Bacteroidales bacterium]|nr:quinolinate synthase NadA [Bacteroidales bacterium]